MSSFSNQEQTTIVPDEEVANEGELPTNPGQAQNITILQQLLVQQYNQQYHTTTYNLPEQSYVSSGDEGSKSGFKKLQQAIRKQYHSKHDVVLSNFVISPEAIPEIHSEMYQVNFYEGMLIPDDDNYNSKRQGINLSTSHQAVTIDQLVSDIRRDRFVSVIGYPGSGKTTLSKRLARYLAKSEGVLVLRKLFMDMNDSNEQLTLKEFLLGDCNYNLNDEEKQSVFEWVTTNPENCFIILDGFDQVSWNLKTKFKKSQYSTPLNYCELMSNLCLGKFLQNCHLIFTSRPHAMLKIPQQCRPDHTYVIHELTSDNMKTLFDALINDQHKCKDLWDNLTVKTPHLMSVCHNPLMLQLYLRASFRSLHEVTDISTMSRIFYAVLLNLKNSEHAISLSDDIVIRLSQIAYIATKEGTVLITAEDLANKNLSSQKVQDLVVTLLGANREYALLEGKQRLYFNHQTFQEYFSALYICRQMSLPDFTSFVQDDVLKDHWAVVVQFLSGLLLDPFLNKDLLRSSINDLPSSQSTPPSSQVASSTFNSTTTQSPSDAPSTLPEAFFQQTTLSTSSEKFLKKKIFISELHKKTREVAASTDLSGNRSIIQISKILREGNDKKVVLTTGSHFDGGKISMNSCTQNDFHAMTPFLKSMPRVKFLGLFGCFMTSNQFRPWIEAIKSMPGSIFRMNLDVNHLSSVDDVIEVLDKVEDRVWMRLCLDDGAGESRNPNMEERSRLQEALNELENKKLRIGVDVNDDGNCIYLTHKDALLPEQQNPSVLHSYNVCRR